MTRYVACDLCQRYMLQGTVAIVVSICCTDTHNCCNGSFGTTNCTTFTLRAVLRCYVRAVLRRTALHCTVLRSTTQYGAVERCTARRCGYVAYVNVCKLGDDG